MIGTPTKDPNTRSDKRPVWWVRPKPNPQAALRLLCFPYAGGTASVFRTWHLALTGEVEVYGIQLPGRANRFVEPAFTRAPELVEVLGPALGSLFDKPFVFFGHSMGAIISFELSRWLRRHGKPLPSHLFVAGRRAPQIPDTDPPRYLLNDADFITSLSELNGIPNEVMNNPDLVRLALPVLRADVELSETYEYREEPPLTCPITAFGGVDDKEESLDIVNGWSAQTNSVFSFHAMAGDHFFIQSNETELLKLMRNELYKTLVSI